MDSATKHVTPSLNTLNPLPLLLLQLLLLLLLLVCHVGHKNDRLILAGLSTPSRTWGRWGLGLYVGGCQNYGPFLGP